ncbi:fumble-domain-containing protein [Tuber magnatum]|uniref:Fumble-domain-containing protein n=1 Tax=Tuber magnatum TaxID=42249 RepID=A0A317SI58_9PEZI|nr:fumble-domain-containing protein [Tuber magnatum]
MSTMSPEEPQPDVAPKEVVNRPRKNTAFEQLDRPGSVRINVQGAFIVDDDSSTPPRSGSPPRYTGPGETKDIRLPHHKTGVSHIAVDIGGSLAKCVYFTQDPNGQGGKLSFKNFETEHIDDLIGFMDSLVNGKRSGNDDCLVSKKDRLHIMATGGGAYKYYDKIKEALGVEVYREDEMECLIVGLDFFITEIPDEVFTYSEEEPTQFAERRVDIYPYLLVNIGSGVSMIKVSGPQQFQRIGGSSLGGGTLWGLLSLLTSARSFDEMLGMAEKGDNAKVDMLVGDIYGGGYGRMGLKSSTIASSFGKVFKKQVESGAEYCSESSTASGMNRGFEPEDISRSLLYAVSNNIGQIAYLQAQNHGLEHIYFGGSFIRGHKQTMNTLSYAIKFWSKGEKKAYFLRHEGYLGSVGAFIRRQPRNWGRRYSTGDEHPYPGIRFNKEV